MYYYFPIFIKVFKTIYNKFKGTASLKKYLSKSLKRIVVVLK